MWRIREFKRGILNIISWLPVIWRDRDWDSGYIEYLLLFKIRKIRKYKKRHFSVGYENDIKWMKKCEYLLTMLKDAKYWDDEYDSKYISKNMLENIPFYDRCVEKHMCNDLWETKARRLFWKIFIAQYEKWWD